MRPIKHKASSEQATSVPCSASLYSINRTIVCINQYKWSTNQITPANTTAASTEYRRVWPLSYDNYVANNGFLNFISHHTPMEDYITIQHRCILGKCFCNRKCLYTLNVRMFLSRPDWGDCSHVSGIFVRIYWKTTNSQIQTQPLHAEAFIHSGGPGLARSYMIRHFIT